MKIFSIVLVVLVFFACKGEETHKKNIQITEKIKDTSISIQKQETQVRNVDKIKTVSDEPKEGFLFINISSIYYQERKLAILNAEHDTITFFNSTKVRIGDNEYDIINQEHLYKEKVIVKSFDPEYGLFILDCKDSSKPDFYEIIINREKGFISKRGNNKDILNFKTPEQYVLEGYPNPTNENPLRLNPSDDAEIVPGFLEHTYVSIEINGDWLKVRDDKDCYPGEEPSKKDIIGWVRWRKNGKIVIDIRHLC